ncbi:MAG: hypothetical protein K6F71_06250 [Ruminococcus sp.]|uniref:Anaerobic ribonucleoside-triphosphate reductase n=1 Tax=Ruminococcus albus TaxID=1264 RepID=A0A1I1M5Y4_RUMAL|nr:MULTISPECIES: anaerobic ribonucleoside-triphosphate reductase [Ruminococcus]MBO4865722.1 hypothetical protein [Ruminococcus sp.]MCR5540407.1 hypothetical protein [Ruminococcus sp.]SFC80456.1 Anaerobic ribonucleoside-triphosphate reductase [Ruminococcus albus]
MKVKVIGIPLPEEEIEEYKKYVSNKHPEDKIAILVIESDGEYVDLTCYTEAVPFERIRRITGYLVGSLDRFNDAKRAEVADRVSHDTEQFVQEM